MFLPRLPERTKRAKQWEAKGSKETKTEVSVLFLLQFLLVGWNLLDSCLD